MTRARLPAEPSMGGPVVGVVFVRVRVLPGLWCRAAHCPGVLAALLRALAPPGARCRSG